MLRINRNTILSEDNPVDILNSITKEYFEDINQEIIDRVKELEETLYKIVKIPKDFIKL